MNTTNGGREGHDQITIQGKTFWVPLRYKTGHVLTENEASTLNQTLHENLRNNFAKKVTEADEAGVDHATLQAQLDDYASDYQFGVRTGGGGFRGDPVLTAAMAMAREVIRKIIKEKGLDQDEWPPSRISQAAKALLERQGDDGAIISAARKQVETEREVGKAAMADISEVLGA